MTPDQPVRRRLDAEERREAILQAAARLFADASYSQVSAAQIAAEAGSSQALIFHYFGSKAGLYAALMTRAVDSMVEAQKAADAALPQGNSARDRVRTSLEVYLDRIAAHPANWASGFTGGDEPAEGQQIRRDARAAYVSMLRDLLGTSDWARHEYAIWGYFGFVDTACLRWVEQGCPANERNPLIDAALGALEGALGDWGS
ncbi:MAG: helix-turn-helix domain-containing protein [Dermatophilus congolensis]|nr:helix-turn-helix domain-containing protein [Dermatophilus congolensis]